MDTKKVYQYCLLIFLITVSILFYYKYFAEDEKKIENYKSESVSEKKILK